MATELTALMAIREDILTAAARAFGKVGYEKATLDDVARIVGIRKASLYHHIRSKEELLLALHERTAGEALTRTKEALEDVRSPDDRMRAFVRVLMGLINDHPDESIVFLHEPLPRSKRWRDVIGKRDEYEQLLRTILADGIKAGAFRDVNVKIVALGVLGMVNWAHRWFRPSAGMSAESIADVFADLVLRGLRERPAKGRARPRLPVRQRRAGLPAAAPRDRRRAATERA